MGLAVLGKKQVTHCNHLIVRSFQTHSEWLVGLAVKMVGEPEIDLSLRERAWVEQVVAVEVVVHYLADVAVVGAQVDVNFAQIVD